MEIKFIIIRIANTIKFKMPDKKKAWYNRYNEFINISKTKNVECLDSEQIYIEKTSRYGC